MALLRFPIFNSTPLMPIKNPNHLFDFSASSFSLSAPIFPPRLATKTRQPTLYVLSSSVSDSSAAVLDNPVPELESFVKVSQSRLCAQNIPWTYTPDDIRSLFKRYGMVVDVELSMHKKTLNRGLAFVTMGSSEEAIAALSNLDSLEVDGRKLKVNYAKLRIRTPTVPKHYLFVGNLPFQAENKDLKEFFESEKTKVVSAEVVFHENPRRSSGYGYVSYDSRVKAATACSTFNGKLFMGRPIRVERTTRVRKKKSEASAECKETLPNSNGDVNELGESDNV